MKEPLQHEKLQILRQTFADKCKILIRQELVCNIIGCEMYCILSFLNYAARRCA